MSALNEKAEGQGSGAPDDSARTIPDGSFGTPGTPGTAASSGVYGARPLAVHFSNPDEFLAELRAREPNLEPVVRITFRWTRDESGAPLVHLTVFANYLRRLGDDPGGGVVVSIVHLGRYVGAVWEEGRDELSDR